MLHFVCTPQRSSGAHGTSQTVSCQRKTSAACQRGCERRNASLPSAWCGDCGTSGTRNASRRSARLRLRLRRMRTAGSSTTTGSSSRPRCKSYETGRPPQEGRQSGGNLVIHRLIHKVIHRVTGPLTCLIHISTGPGAEVTGVVTPLLTLLVHLPRPAPKGSGVGRRPPGRRRPALSRGARATTPSSTPTNQTPAAPARPAGCPSQTVITWRHHENHRAATRHLRGSR